MKKFFKFGCLGFIGLIILIVILAALGDSSDSNLKEESKTEQSTDTNETTEVKKENTNKLTKEKFDKIEDGMTYEEVVKIVGSEGKLMSETGDPGTEFHTQMYEFETDKAFTGANMTFQNGKLINKTQIGLGGDSDAKISLKEFEQIQNGMTYEEVAEIIGGEGEKQSETGSPGTDLHTVIYSYNGEKGIGANANFTFQGGKLMNKAQFGLE
ncbi:DUF3862 domain-containing protein [Bacillus sp. REN10]|uniref:DUF3862 domain-containing protein n=1 Tax=Bacillus sp. REN10 TaxID=2782541 RepID=UPI00193B42D2|nr:DUF3862 domain-containing protein [Bacillus sp. REN10]